MLGSTSLSLLYLVILATVIVVGLVGNGFLIIANSLDWIRSKTLPASDMIVLALSLSRLLFLGMTLGIHCSFLLDIEHPKLVPSSFLFFWSFLNAVSLWLATCLAVFYCMKIIVFTQPFLVKMKLRISRMVPQLVLGSMLASLLASFPYNLLNNCSKYCNVTGTILDYSNGTSLASIPSYLTPAIIYITATFPSFIIFLVSSALLINSLLQHVRKMKQSTEGFQDQRMNIHVKAIKILIFFLLLCSASFAAEISLTLLFSIWAMFVSIAVISACHSGHAILLIVINSKLKETLSRILWNSMDHCLGRTMSSSPKIPEDTLPC